METEVGPGASAFPWRKRDKQQRQVTGGSAAGSSGGGSGWDGGQPEAGPAGAPPPGEEGGSLFTEPLQWMAGMVVGGPVQGKLYCPK